ncbi:MAG: hypothetical protein WBQ60_11875 [Asticcacaulis sp.]
MSISGDYGQPVNVNGFSCKNCTDVDYAKKHIDPAHPKSGPYGVNTDSDPSQKADRQQAVRFGGQLRGMNLSQLTDTATSAQAVLPGRLFEYTGLNQLLIISNCFGFLLIST